MTQPLCHVCLMVAVLLAVRAAQVVASEPADAPKAFVDGTGPGWNSLG